jgi:ecotin
MNRRQYLPLLAMILTSTGFATDIAKELKAFPEPEPGMTRHVITLQSQPDEDLLKVQLLIGKTMQLDAHNRYFYGGLLETKTVTGWGYDYLILRKLGPMAGTLMAVDPNEPKVDRFITLGGEPQLLRYNSRLPLVVYTPEGVEVRYKLWRADQKELDAPKG